MTPAGSVPRLADVTLHILHTNDFHNALTDAGAERLRQAVASLRGEPYLLLDAGDALKAGNIGFSPFGEPILGRMNDIGYHAMTMGNREFHVWQKALTTKIKDARFPILSANIRRKSDFGKRRPVQPYAIFQAGPLKVAVLGVTVPMVTPGMKISVLSTFVFDDPIKTASRVVKDVRWGADVVIALTHIGLREDRRLAVSVPGIDLIVGGHSHDSLMEPLQEEGGTPIVQAGFFAHSYGHVKMTVGVNGVTSVTSSLYPLQAPRS